MKLIFELHVYRVHPNARPGGKSIIPHRHQDNIPGIWNKNSEADYILNSLAFLDAGHARDYEEDSDPVWIRLKFKKL